MTALFWLLGICAILGACWLVGVIEQRRTIILYAHEFSCPACSSGYSHPQAFAWHWEANHSHARDYDSDRAPNATHRRDDVDRNYAGEILGGEGRASHSTARPAGLMEQRTRDHLFSTEKS